MFNGELIFHKKDTEKVVLFFVTSERLDIKFRAKKLCAHLYYAPNTLLWAQNFVPENNFVAIL